MFCSLFVSEPLGFMFRRSFGLFVLTIPVCRRRRRAFLQEEGGGGKGGAFGFGPLGFEIVVGRRLCLAAR